MGGDSISLARQGQAFVHTCARVWVNFGHAAGAPGRRQGGTPACMLLVGHGEFAPNISGQMYPSHGTVQFGLERSGCAPRAAGGFTMAYNPWPVRYVARSRTTGYHARWLKLTFCPGNPGKAAVREARGSGFRLLRFETPATTPRIPAHRRNSCALEIVQVHNSALPILCKTIDGNILSRLTSLSEPPRKGLDACCAGADKSLSVGRVQLLRDHAEPEAWQRNCVGPGRARGLARRRQTRPKGFRREVSRSPTCRPCGLRLKQAFTLFAI